MIAVTVLELLKQKLHPSYVLAIIDNMDDKLLLDEESDGILLHEIEDLFNWSKSNEGYNFWERVFDAVKNGKPLPKIPFRAKWQPNTYLSLDKGNIIINAKNSGEDLLVEIPDKAKKWSERFFLERHQAFVN